jgi:hypothetical protein
MSLEKKADPIVAKLAALDAKAARIAGPPAAPEETIPLIDEVPLTDEQTASYFAGFAGAIHALSRLAETVEQKGLKPQAQGMVMGCNLLWLALRGMRGEPLPAPGAEVLVLAACPCGGPSGDIHLKEEKGLEAPIFVECQNCGRRGPGAFSDEGAINAWTDEIKALDYAATRMDAQEVGS